MLEPRGHHFLPQRAHLRFFKSPKRPGFVWSHRRGQEPFLESIRDAAKQRDLYTVRLADGTKTAEIEKELAGLEQRAGPTLARLNEATRTLRLSLAERHEVVDYVTMLAVRTPAFLAMVNEMSAQQLKEITRTAFGRPGAIEAMLEEQKRTHPGKFESITPDMARAVLLGDAGRFEPTHDHQVKIAFGMAKVIFNCLNRKRLSVLKADQGFFITSDDPVLPIAHGEVPAELRNGFLFADVFVPIEKGAALLLQNKPTQKAASGEEVVVPMRRASAKDVRSYNGRLMDRAEAAIYTHELNDGIRKRFDRTSRPHRVEVSRFGPLILTRWKR